MESAQIPQPPSSPTAESRGVIRITRIDESVEIMEENQVMLQCVIVIELNFVEKHSGSGKESRRVQSMTITSKSQIVKVMTYVLFYSFFSSFVILLFNSLHSSDQSSVQNLSAQPSVTTTISKISARVALDMSESLLSPSVASFGQVAQDASTAPGSGGA